MFSIIEEAQELDTEYPSTGVPNPRAVDTSWSVAY